MKTAISGTHAPDVRLNKKGNLIFFEFPILSHFQDQYGADYLMQATDKDSTHSRWLAFKVSRQGLDDHFSFKKSLLDLLEENPDRSVVFVDADAKGVHQQMTRVAIADIPAIYLPLETSFFDEELYEDYALELKNSLSSYKKKAIGTINATDKDNIQHFVVKLKQGNLLDSSKIVFRTHNIAPFALLAAYNLLRGKQHDGYEEIIAGATRIGLIMDTLESHFIDLENRIEQLNKAGIFPEFNEAIFHFQSTYARSIVLKVSEQTNHDEKELVDWLKLYFTHEKKQAELIPKSVKKQLTFLPK